MLDDNLNDPEKRTNVAGQPASVDELADLSSRLKMHIVALSGVVFSGT
jgi:hypothetical protein